MEPSEQSQPPREEPVKSIEDDGKGAGVTNEQWKAMMAVVMAIYDFREAE